MSIRTHPHQWTPPQKLLVYGGFHDGAIEAKPTRRNVENFICHNGDLVSFDCHLHH